MQQFLVLPEGATWKVLHGQLAYTGYKTQDLAAGTAIAVAERWGSRGVDAEVHVYGPDGALIAAWVYERTPENSSHDPRRPESGGGGVQRA
ncbi:hypothetical protein [Roseomonas chloroacetimidivorans]|uniref:hypothetical protein n=1 Tax=Roseomonas chloroacetimidivorans TaxID=1766656 RepID=UPI003C7767AD